MPAYKWNQLSARQQETARRIRDELAEQYRIGASVSQIARHFDEAMEWKRGGLALEEFARLIGGTPIQ